jgi:hypothetical protein
MAGTPYDEGKQINREPRDDGGGHKVAAIFDAPAFSVAGRAIQQHGRAEGADR